MVIVSLLLRLLLSLLGCPLRFLHHLTHLLFTLVLLRTFNFLPLSWKPLEKERFSPFTEPFHYSYRRVNFLPKANLFWEIGAGGQFPSFFSRVQGWVTWDI